MKPIDEISSDIIGVAMSIHREIGPGLLESVYQAILAKKLSRLGYEVEIEKPWAFLLKTLNFHQPSKWTCSLIKDWWSSSNLSSGCSLFMRSNCSLIFV